MGISFDKALGIHPQALQVRDGRTQLLAENIANADTPRYKAQDIDFRAIMQQSLQSQHKMDTSHPDHINPDSGPIPQGMVQFRIPTQPSMDGNTVDAHIEKSEFTRNALEMQASLRFLNGRISGIKNALKGEA